jgi:hypothetical protein
MIMQFYNLELLTQNKELNKKATLLIFCRLVPEIDGRHVAGK